jgi:hypothetical protein
MELVQDTGPASAVELPAVEVAAATAAAAIATTSIANTQRETLINSILDGNGNLPTKFDNERAKEDAQYISRYVAAIEKNPNAVLGFKKAGGPMPPNTFRRVECCRAILRNAPNKVALRRRFLVMAMALLLPQGAYPAFLDQYHPGAVPVGNTSLGFVKPSKRTPTIRYVGDCLFNAGVTPLEASQWDEFVFAYCQDYLADPSACDDDEIRLAMQDRLQPPASPQGYRILECVGRGARIPRMIYNRRLPLGDEPNTPSATKPRATSAEYEAALKDPARTFNMFERSSDEEDWFDDD